MRLLPLAAVAGLAIATPGLAQTPSQSPPAGNSASATVPAAIVPVGQWSPPAGSSYLNEPVVTATSPTPMERITTAGEPLQSTRFWANADYLVWWENGSATPPLVQTIPAAVATAGPTNLPFGANQAFPRDNKLYFGAFSGVRATVGMNFGPNWGVDLSGFVLNQQSTGYSLIGDGSPTSIGIARPYIQAGTGNPISLYSNLPGQYAGGVRASADSQFWGLDANARLEWYRLFCDRCDLLAGFRYYGLEESVTINDISYFPGNVVNTVHDSFQTRNNFYGAQVGAQTQWFFGRLSADLSLKGAIGGMHQQVIANGSNTFVQADGTVNIEQGGLYARGANAGNFSRDKFAFTGEVGTNLNYEVCKNVRVRIGYTLNYLSSVARAGEFIDPRVNDQNVRFVLRQAPSNAVAPAFNWSNASDFWVQGINFGVVVGY